MKKSVEFMLLFRFTPSNDYQPSEAELAEQHAQWGSFIGNLAIQEKLVSTYQLGFTGKQVNAAGQVSDGFYLSEGTSIGGNLVIRVNTIEEATEIAKDCPILTMGGSVEIREILPMD